MLIKCFRNDRFYPAIRRFVSLKLGSEFLDPPLVHFHDILQKSSARQPIVVIRCDATEPTHSIENLTPNSPIVTLDGHSNEVSSCAVYYCNNYKCFHFSGIWIECFYEQRAMGDCSLQWFQLAINQTNLLPYDIQREFKRKLPTLDYYRGSAYISTRRTANIS